jgi:predicted amidohydrolase YtcJ
MRPTSIKAHEIADGSLEVGKLADLIVLDRNLLQIPPRDIAAVKVLLAVVGGHAVYQGPEFEGANR